MQKIGNNDKSVPPQGSPRSKFTDFCKHCSLHGFYYFHKSSNAFVHIVWSAIILSSVVLCGYLGWMIFQKFVVDPTLTVVESSNYPISEIPFPAVTICETDMVYGPSTTNITKMLVYRGYNSTQISEFYRSFTDVKKAGYNPAPYLKKMHDMLDDLGYSFNSLLDLLKKPCEALLVSCAWRSKLHDCSLMFRQEFRISGYCCKFDMNFFQHYANSATTFISGVQTTEALDVMVDGRTFPPGENATQGHVLLYVFDQHDTITFLDNSVTITPSSHFDVNVDVWTIDSSDYVKALSVKSRRCILESDATYGAGFYHGCMVQHIMRRVVEICRCIPYHYTASELRVDIKKQCTWERLICIYENTDKVLGNMKSVIADSECYQRCDYVQYETEVKQVWQQRRFVGKTKVANDFQNNRYACIQRFPATLVWSSEHLRGRQNPSDLDQGFSRIMVHFVKNTCLKYRREVLYTWDQVLANLGGIFGLCLGGSIISIIELTWFLFDFLFTVVRNCFMKKMAPKKQKQQEFVMKMSKIGSKDIVEKYKFTH